MRFTNLVGYVLVVAILLWKALEHPTDAPLWLLVVLFVLASWLFAVVRHLQLRLEDQRIRDDLQADRLARLDEAGEHSPSDRQLD